MQAVVEEAIEAERKTSGEALQAQGQIFESMLEEKEKEKAMEERLAAAAAAAAAAETQQGLDAHRERAAAEPPHGLAKQRFNATLSYHQLFCDPGRRAHALAARPGGQESCESFVGGGRAVVTSPVGKPSDMAAAKVFLVNKGSKAGADAELDSGLRDGLRMGQPINMV